MPKKSSIRPANSERDRRKGGFEQSSDDVFRRLCYHSYYSLRPHIYLDGKKTKIGEEIYNLGRERDLKNCIISPRIEPTENNFVGNQLHQ